MITLRRWVGEWDPTDDTFKNTSTEKVLFNPANVFVIKESVYKNRTRWVVVTSVQGWSESVDADLETVALVLGLKVS